MRLLKAVLDFYIQASIHVALACYALVLMTQHMFGLSSGGAISYFALFGTIVAYNFVKYDALARTASIRVSNRLRAIAVVSSMAFALAAYAFMKLQWVTQLTALCFVALTLLYTLPFFPNRANARNWAGIKIYMVSLCWVGVTVVLPVIDGPTPESVFTSDFILKCIQRFILVFVLVLIFEIIDMKNDDPHLQTVPQQIGTRRTKFLGVILLLGFYLLELLRKKPDMQQLVVNALLVCMVVTFLLFADHKKSRYYASFGVESIPIIWWLLVSC